MEVRGESIDHVERDVRSGFDFGEVLPRDTDTGCCLRLRFTSVPTEFAQTPAHLA